MKNHPSRVELNKVADYLLLLAVEVKNANDGIENGSVQELKRAAELVYKTADWLPLEPGFTRD